MLVQFSVENFLSFDRESLFSMVSAGGDQHPRHLVPGVPRKGEALLRGAAIYGANGAGKSNLVQSIRFAQTLVVQGTRGRQAIPVRPFRLSPSGSSRPSKFEFVIQTAGIVYNYGFRVDTNRVCEEWLYATPRTQEVLYFQRVAAEDGTVQVEFGPSWVGRGNKRKQFLEFVAQGTRPNQLFLTEAVERNLQECLPLVEWFRTRLIVLSAESSMNDLEMRVQGDRPLAQFVEAVLSSTGTGIEAILAEETPFDLDSLVPALPDPVKQSLEANLAESEAVIVNLHGPQDQRKILKRGPQGELKAVSLRMLHSAAEGPPVAFSMEEESDGTQRLIHLTPALSLLRQNSEQVLLIDELDRRLHTQLSRFFVQAALDYDDSPRQTQLIFTTHDTNLLDLDLLRRDEIWFVEKDNGGASHVYSLAEFKIRPDLKVEKGYLSGRFGALPFLGDIRRLGLTESGATEAGDGETPPKALQIA